VSDFVDLRHTIPPVLCVTRYRGLHLARMAQRAGDLGHHAYLPI